MRFSFLIIIFLFSSPNLQSQNGWYQQYILNGYFFSGMQFINIDTAYVSGFNNNSSIILKTNNSGNNWNIISTINSSRIRSIYFKNEATGWACGEESTLGEAAIYKSTNSGVNWILQMHEGFWELNDIIFNNDSTGWAIGWFDQVYRTTNSGNNWVIRPGLGSEVNDIHFLNSQYGWIAGGGESGSIVRTTNGGNNWIVDIHQWTGYNSVHFINQNSGWAAGYYNDPQWGVVSRTTNGGVNWNIQTINYLEEVLSVNFVDSLNGWIIAVVTSGQTGIFRSFTGGISWQPQTGNIPFVTKLYFRNSFTGWAVGNVILKTTTGGITPILTLGTLIPEQFSLHQNYPNPFNPSTKIKFEIPLSRGVSEGRGVLTKLFIYDILGREIRTLVNENLKPGVYEVDFNAADLPSGVYFYKLSAGQFVDVKKMIIMK